MRYYDGRFLIYNSGTGFRADEISTESLNDLGGPEMVKLRLDENTDTVLPFIVKKPLVSPDQMNLNGWMVKATSDPKGAQKLLLAAFAKNKLEANEYDINTLLEVPINCVARKNSPVPKDFLKYSSGDASATHALKRRIIEDDIQYKFPNKTLMQQTNTDKLSVRLPDADVIFTHDLGSSYSARYSEIPFRPYPSNLYRVKHIINILKAPTASARSEQIKNVINILKNTYYVDINEAQARKLKSDFELLPYEHVYGHRDNDTLPIMDNEREFYDNLVAFIKWHIQAFNKEVMSGATDEEILIKSENDFNSGILPMRLQEYLQSFLFRVMDAQYSHTGNFTNEKDFKADDDDSDGDEDRSSGTDDGYKMLSSKRDPKSSDLDILAGNYLTISSQQYSASVWAEGLIKLMRWGDRKVENLYVGSNNTQYFDIASMELVTTQTADLSNFEAILDEDGRSLTPLALSICEFKPGGQSRRKAYPFVLVAYEVGKLPGMDEPVKPLYLLTLFDIVRSYLTDKPMLQGIYFADGRFESDFAEDLTIVSLADMSQKPVFILDELTDYAVDNNISKVSGTAAVTLNPSNLEEYRDSSPLLDRLGKTPKQLRNSVVQGALLDIFQEGAADINIVDLVDLLNWYMDEIYATHEAAYCNLFGYSAAEVSTESEAKLNTRNLETANFFGMGAKNSIEQEVIEEKREEVEFMYNVYNGKEELKFDKIMHTLSGVLTPVGAVAVTTISGSPTMVLAAVNEIPSFAVNAEEKLVNSMIMRMFDAAVCADTRNDLQTKTMVMSNDTISLIYKAVKGV